MLAAVLLVSAMPASAGASRLAGDRIGGEKPKTLDVPRSALPDVSMRAGVLVSEDGVVLWSRKPDARREIASITKIMTAVVALENSHANDVITVSTKAGHVGESTSFLSSGDELKMSEALEGLLVKSGNDAAMAIAEHVAGDEERFVELMNRKAKQLGLEHTRFSNPHGLDGPAQYSSASDVAVLSRYAMRKPEIRRIVAEKTARIDHEGVRQKVDSTNLLLFSYDGANGIKTGYTGDAGYCVSASARRFGIELYAVVLGTGSEQKRFEDARELLDWGFAHYREQKLASAGTVVGEAPVADYLDLSVPGAVSVETTLPVFDIAGPVTRTVKMARVHAPVERGDRVGVVTFSQGGRVLRTVPLVATADVKKPSVLARLGIGIVRLWRRLTG